MTKKSADEGKLKKLERKRGREQRKAADGRNRGSKSAFNKENAVYNSDASGTVSKFELHGEQGVRGRGTGRCEFSQETKAYARLTDSEKSERHFERQRPILGTRPELQ